MTFNISSIVSGIKQAIQTPTTAPAVTSNNNNNVSQATEDYFTRSLPKNSATTPVQYFELIKKTIDTLNDTSNEPDLDTVFSFSGFGPIREIFDETKKNHDQRRNWLLNELSDSEFRSAKEATLSSFYTPMCISNAIWDGYVASGFASGRIMDPAAATGRLIASIPTEIKNDSDLTLIEYDKLSYKCCEALYPNAATVNAEYQDVTIKKQDLIVSNPPYNSVLTSDRSGLKLNGYKLHDFFVLKSASSLRENGFMTLILPTSFMDSSCPKVRTELAKLANFVGGVRVPYQLFEKQSATKTAVDVLCFQCSDQPESNPLWLDTSENFVGTEFYTHNNTLDSEIFVNLAAPEQGILFGAPMVLWGDKGTSNLDQRVYDAVNKLHAALSYQSFEHDDVIASNITLKDPSTAAAFTFNIDFDDNLVFQTTSGFEPLNIAPSGIKAKRISGLISLAAIAEKLMLLEANINSGESELDDVRQQLNTTYDQFVKKMGYLTSRSNALAFKRDGRYPLLLALECDYDAGISKAEAKRVGCATKPPKATKAVIFSKRAFKPWTIPNSAENVQDGLALSLAYKGVVDFPLISELVGETEQTVRGKLLGKEVFFDPSLKDFALAEDYLSGDILTKIELAQKYEPLDPRMISNLVALESVKPERVLFGDIAIQMKSFWLPPELLERFLIETFGFSTSLVAKYVLGKWIINLPMQYSSLARIEYSTNKHDLRQILNIIFKHGNTVVKIYDDNGKVIGVDHETTSQLKLAIKNIEYKWLEFISEPQISRKLEDIYNAQINRFAPFLASFSDCYFPDLNPNFKLYKHQIAAIRRANSITDSGFLLDSAIGSGKTGVYVVTAHEAVRLGLRSRIAIVCPNHLTSQIAAEWMRLYPTDRNNLLVLNSKSMSPSERIETLQRIKTSDINYIIIPFSTNKKLSAPIEATEKVLNDRLDELDELVRHSDDRFTVREAETQKKRLAEQLKAVRSNNTGPCFEELGINGIIVDECQLVKNSGYSSSYLSGVKGTGTTTSSQIALDMSFKVSYLINKYKNSGVLFGSGTVISNSLLEIYGYSRMLAPKLLKNAGMNCLDDWATNFVSCDEDYEIKPDGSVQLVRRAKAFNNISELAALYSAFSFTITSEQLQDLIPKITAKDGSQHSAIVPFTSGKPISIMSKTTDETMQYMNTLVERARDYKNSPVENDNALLLISDARKSSISPLMVDPRSDEVFSQKTKDMINNIIRIYHEGEDLKTSQLAFVDFGTPSSSKDEQERYIMYLRRKEALGCSQSTSELNEYRGVSVNLYRHIKHALVQGGIPEDQIAFTQDYDTDAKKISLYDQINSGKKRVVLSTFERLATGSNIQERMKAIHVLSPPLRPSDLSQGLGRGSRQGHKVYEAALKEGNSFSLDAYLYSQEKSVDAWLYQLLQAKASTIANFRKGTMSGVRQLKLESDILSFAEIKASVSGNETLIELMKVDRELFEQEANYRSFLNKQSRMSYSVDRLNRQIEIDMLKQANIKTDKEEFSKIVKSGNVVLSIDSNEYRQLNQQVGDTLYSRYSVARRIAKKSAMDREFELAKIAGFELVARQSVMTNDVVLVSDVTNHEYPIEYRNVTKLKLLPAIIQILQSFDFMISSIGKRIEENKNSVAELNGFQRGTYDLNLLHALEAKKIELTKLFEMEDSEVSKAA